MAPLPGNDIGSTQIELDEEQSMKFLEFLYPDHRLFSKRKYSSRGVTTMDQMLKIFEDKHWYGPHLGKGQRRAQWILASGCPSLGPNDIVNREFNLGNFFNNILRVISGACSLSFFRWDAKSSKTPSEESPVHWKPDLMCYFTYPTPFHHWGQVASFCEVKNQDGTGKKNDSFVQIADKVAHILASQDGRHLLPCICLLGSSICLTIFDRGGSITTCTFNIHRSPKEFLRILIAVSLVDYGNIGFDMSIKWDGKGGTPADGTSLRDENASWWGHSEHEDEPSLTKGGDSARRKWLRVIDQEGIECKIWLRTLLAIPDSLLGRGTATVWEGLLESDSPRKEVMVTVKDSWIDPLRKYREGMVLCILASFGIEGIPELVAEWQVSGKHIHGDTDINLSTHFIRSKLSNICSLDNYNLRVLSRLVTLPVGILLINFTSLGELLVAFLDCIIAHKNALKQAGILHRDISPSNILLTQTGKKQVAHEEYLACYLTGQAQSDLKRRIDNLTWRGVLTGWDHAAPVSTPNLVHPSSIPQVHTSNAHCFHTSDGLTPTHDISSMNLVPVRQIGTNSKTMTIPTSELTDEHDIVLLMGKDDPKEDSRHTIDSCSMYHMGTWSSWMSAELTMASPEQPVVHNELHDLESFFYVLVGICVLYSGPSKLKAEEELIKCYDQLFNTSGPSILKTIIIQSNVTWFPKVIKHISPCFQPVIPLLNDLRDKIILPMYTDEKGKLHYGSSFNHDMVIQSIVLLLASLGPEAWTIS